MAHEVPTRIPDQLTAGDTATWKITLPNYPATDGWVLSYRFIKRTGGLNIAFSASASGSDHLVSVTAATTALWVAGDYDVQAYATKASTSERYQVWSGQLLILTNYAAAEDGLDTRSMARKIFDAFEAAILKVSLAQQSAVAGSITEWTVEGMHVKRSTPEQLMIELINQRDRYKAIVLQEEARIRVQQGRGSRKRILTQFSPAC